MTSPIIIYVDTIGLDRAASLKEAANRHGIGLAVIGPPETINRRQKDFAKTVITSDFSYRNLRRIFLRLEKTFTIVGVYSSFGPFRPEGFVQESLSRIAMERELPFSGYEALYRATNKFLARQALDAAGIPNIAFGVAVDETSLISAARRIGYPVVLKPLTGVGSSLIFKCSNDDDATRKFALALRGLKSGYYEQLRMAPHRMPGDPQRFNPRRSMLVEKYIDGREASVECLVVGRRVLPLVIHDKIVLEERENVVLEHLLVAPAERFSRDEIKKMRAYAVRAVEAIGVRDMFCHVELRYDDIKGPVLLELNPRIGAGCVRDSIELFTEINVDDMQIALITGKATLPSINSRCRRRHALGFIFSPRSGVICKLSGLRRALAIPGLKAIRTGYGVGDRVGGDSEEIFLASFWFEAANGSKARTIYDKIKQAIEVQVS